MAERALDAFYFVDLEVEWVDDAVSHSDQVGVELHLEILVHVVLSFQSPIELVSPTQYRVVTSSIVSVLKLLDGWRWSMFFSLSWRLVTAVAALGGCDLLVNNASGFGSTDDDKGWGTNFAVDMMAIVHATQEALPALKKGPGSVVNISSIAAHHPAARQPPYGAMKAAVIHYTTTQAAMYARDKVRVNCIAPGSVDFPGGVWDRRKTDNPALYNGTLASIPFGRMGMPEEIANVALFLASPLASWVTGQTIAVAGGQGL